MLHRFAMTLVLVSVFVVPSAIVASSASSGRDPREPAALGTAARVRYELSVTRARLRAARAMLDRQVAQIQRDNFRKAHAAGVKMVFGSDAGVMPHGSAAGQLRVMVEYGMTPIQAIRAATRNAAEALSRAADVGTLAVGRYGDIVAVTGDPLTNVRLLEKPSAVIKGGVRIK